ncbi:alpha-tocopherol transfer protein [Leptinotarsa decemlineata]|uniref:alpha-tocopherol transfer protein n=1 Tax=Leptinotarsa decemlineata TaxID=7539 RepID=UPI000C2528CD|nr:alpha-tocopherol transfer protein-like [Leptinotarsa decemlineata]
MGTKFEYFENLSNVLKKGLEANDKTEENLNEDINILKRWVASQPHLPEIPNDHMMTCFLIMNKFSIENAKQKIDMYYTMRTLFPEFFLDKHPLSPHIQNTMNDLCFIPLPKATDEGYRVTIIQAFHDNTENFDICNYFSLTYSITEVRFQEDYPVGDVIIYDFSNLRMGHLVQFTPTIMKKTAAILEKTFNNNIKQVHCVNYPSFAEPVINLSMKMVKPKLAERFRFHKKVQDIKNFIPLRILPKDYGGEEKSLKELNEMWKKKFTQYKDRFDVLEKLRVNEKLRPNPLINDEILGFHGNFKKINLD